MDSGEKGTPLTMAEVFSHLYGRPSCSVKPRIKPKAQQLLVLAWFAFALEMGSMASSSAL